MIRFVDGDTGGVLSRDEGFKTCLPELVRIVDIAHLAKVSKAVVFPLISETTESQRSTISSCAGVLRMMLWYAAFFLAAFVVSTAVVAEALHSVLQAAACLELYSWEDSQNRRHGWHQSTLQYSQRHLDLLHWLSH